MKANEKKKRTLAPLPVAVPVLSPVHATAYCGLSVPTLARMRCDGTGPECVELSKKAIGYRIADLDAWLASRPRFKGTSARTVATTTAA